MSEVEIKVVGICGSLRKDSFNMAALRAAGELMPPGMTLSITRIDDLPFYNQDVWDAGLPEPVKRLRAEIAAADAVLIATPEYNCSVSAVLKNAIDWCSRGSDQVFKDKPIAIFSASEGPLGGPRVQYDLRRIFTSIWGHVLPRPEVFIGMAEHKFDATGRLTDETTKKFLSAMLSGFKDWIIRMNPKVSQRLKQGVAHE